MKPLLICAGMLAAQYSARAEQPLDTIQFKYLRTYGSKDGIHPSRFSNKKAAVAATGSSEHPYGLGFPVGVVADARGRIWITDSGTESIHVFDPASGAYKEYRRLPDLPIEQPSGIAADPAGRIYVADTGRANVFVFDPDGAYNRLLLPPESHALSAPTAIATSEDGRTIYVADPPKNAIVAFNREGEVTDTIALTEATRDPSTILVIRNQLYVLGQRQHRVEVFSPGGERRAELKWDGNHYPTALAYDARHRRFLVANPRLSAVEVFNEDDRSVGVFGQLGDGVSQHRQVDGLYWDPRGDVYLIDSHHGKVLVFGPQ